MIEKTVVILTGGEKRHEFARMALAMTPGLRVLASICEGDGEDIRDLVVRRAGPECDQELQFLEERKLAEDETFGEFCRLVSDRSKPHFIRRTRVNSPEITSFIKDQLRPDLLLAYGCSIIKEPLLSSFHRRFLNLHLGLSPYYRGAGTNFWPLVNSEPEYVGATFMHLDSGIDTGEIIHQIRAKIYQNDSVHQLGNRLLVNAIYAYGAIARCIDGLKKMNQVTCSNERIYRKADYNSRSIDQLSRVLQEGLIGYYLRDQVKRDRRVKIVTNEQVVKELSTFEFPARNLLEIVNQEP